MSNKGGPENDEVEVRITQEIFTNCETEQEWLLSSGASIYTMLGRHAKGHTQVT